MSVKDDDAPAGAGNRILAPGDVPKAPAKPKRRTKRKPKKAPRKPSMTRSAVNARKWRARKKAEEEAQKAKDAEVLAQIREQKRRVSESRKAVERKRAEARLAGAVAEQAEADRRRQRELAKQAARSALAIDTLAGFVRHLWPVVEPGVPLVWSWYLQLLCEELEGLIRGEAPDGTPYPEERKELVVCLPPGHAKSKVCSVYLLAWVWLHSPHLRVLSVANEGSLASRDSRLCRQIVTSERYRELQTFKALSEGLCVHDPRAQTRTGDPIFRPIVNGRMHPTKVWKPWGLDDAQAAKVNFDTDQGGGRVALGIQAKVTGKRGGGLIVDDPHDAKEVMVGDPARVAERLKEHRVIYHGVLLSRLNRGGWRLVVAQRLHVADLAGDLIGRGSRVVCLPVRYEPDHPNAHPRDPRQEGELLAPQIFGPDRDRAMRESLGAKHYAAQYRQLPSADAGGIFQRGWFNRQYQQDPLILVRKAHFDEVIISVDCSFRDKKTSDFVVMQAWARKRGRLGREQSTQGVLPGKYLLDQVRARMGLLDTIAALKRFRAKWRQATTVLVEARANGDAVIESMRRDGHPGVVGFEPDRSKIARAQVSALAYEAGEVWLPSERHAPWLGEYVEEHVAFPAGPNDDQVDGTSQIMCRWAALDVDDIAGELSWVDML